jgi:catechol 2,3-dioxygenase-like lactoylglutathione lyase family enzyme
MARIDHVAVESRDPDTAAAFYERVFGARIVKIEGHPVVAYLGRLSRCMPRATPAGRPTTVRAVRHIVREEDLVHADPLEQASPSRHRGRGIVCVAHGWVEFGGL